MSTRRFSFFVKTLIIAVAFLSFNSGSKAQVLSAVLHDPAAIDTTGRYLKENPGFIVNRSLIAKSALKDPALQQELQVSIRKPSDRKALMKHLREMNIGTDLEANQSNKKLLFNLANTFARLKLYSLAMKCFFKTLQYNKADQAGDADTLTTATPLPSDSLNADVTNLDERYLNFNDKDDTLLNHQPALQLPLTDKEPRSPKITYQRIVESFTDGKKAVAYAMLIHVKQPVGGKAKVYKFTNSGHTFITLIKYNSDSTYVSLSFGFYPDKQHPFAGTPLFPGSHSAFRDDGQHKWDEVAGKFISKRRFEKILALTKNYDGVKYHLSKNNCTDFSLNAALMAELSIKETTGKWPLGHGNNPGITGQSMLQGKIADGNKRGLDDVFVDDTVKQ
ncbi:hypothetical protein IDJ77_23200 [Mucilaginibacter sp. ZT4R22]|uniref:DUF4105 domain-containing protein n=1 Tax=Mucilaginibacter pankratovii TaxID=2772110 RepID=A0ABR7WX24_9SPHI|nr:hypothetical protein [Mucilaginibacter pankratovii]MBD1366738.1 hypothetical protein [Mucilaginibacter pankratovii]